MVENFDQILHNTLMYSLTIFKNTYDNKTHRTLSFHSWDKFEELLFNLSEKEGQKGGPNSSPLISPASYFEGSTRSNRNVSSWGSWACVDVDDFRLQNDAIKDEINNVCGHYKYICYSTASSTKEFPKFRLVFPLTRQIDQEEIPHFWFALNKQLKEIGDKQTKDLSRMYYVPAIYPNAYNFIFTNEGAVINPSDLMKVWKYTKPSGSSFLDRLPEALKQEVVNYRKSQAENTSINWTSYRDCPFFPKKLAQEYMVISGTGWYHKMYQIMVAIAANAIKSDYPITPRQIADMCREFDKDTGNWYDNRPLEKEADGAIEYVYRN